MQEMAGGSLKPCIHIFISVVEMVIRWIGASVGELYNIWKEAREKIKAVQRLHKAGKQLISA
jgi:hypothetical protein